jgi:hypothetical protein
MPKLWGADGEFIEAPSPALGWRWWSAGRMLNRDGTVENGDWSFRLRAPWARGWAWKVPDEPGGLIESSCAHCGMRCDSTPHSAHFYAWQIEDLLWPSPASQPPGVRPDRMTEGPRKHRIRDRVMFFQAHGRIRLLDRVQQGISRYAKGEVRSQVVRIEVINVPDFFETDRGLERVVRDLSRYGPVDVMPASEFWPSSTMGHQAALRAATVQVPA